MLTFLQYYTILHTILYTVQQHYNTILCNKQYYILSLYCQLQRWLSKKVQDDCLRWLSRKIVIQVKESCQDSLKLLLFREGFKKQTNHPRGTFREGVSPPPTVGSQGLHVTLKLKIHFLVYQLYIDLFEFHDRCWTVCPNNKN